MSNKNNREKYLNWEVDLYAASGLQDVNASELQHWFSSKNVYIKLLFHEKCVIYILIV